MPNILSIISLQTKSCALIFGSAPNLPLQLMHFGSALSNPSELIAVQPIGPALMPYGPGCHMEPSIKLTQSDCNPSLVLAYSHCSTKKLDANRTHTIITQQDPAYPIVVEVHIVAYHAEDIFESWVEINNTGDSPVTLHACASLFLTGNYPNPVLTHFCSGWAKEMRLEQTQLTEGLLILDAKQGTMNTIDKNPSFLLSFTKDTSETHGEIIGATLRWSGSWRFTFQKDAINRLFISGGTNPNSAEHSINPHSRYKSPAAVCTYSNNGTGLVSRRFHTWARRYAMRHADTVRPIVQNSWEGTYFDFTEEKLLAMMDSASQMGIEQFVLDDGWFGTQFARNNDACGLGDWQVNVAKLPRGLGFLAHEAAKRGMKFGIWVEPEMVNPKSELFRAHPEWALQLPNRESFLQRNQVVLDLANPLVQEFILSIFDTLLADGSITYVKWDSNSSIHNQGSTYLPANRQQELVYQYVHGLYYILNALSKKYPAVLFQACSSGGGRVEYGSLPYFDEFWTSDNTDARDRVFIQWGTSQFFPAMAMAAHVSAAPNDFTRRNISLKFRFDVAMSGRLGVELPSEKMSAEEISFAKQAIAWYKVNRETIQFGDLYRLVSPYTSNMAALMYVSGNKKSALVFAYMLTRWVVAGFPNLKLEGLTASAQYSIVEVNFEPTEPSCAPVIVSGEYLMAVGLPVTSSRQSALDIVLGRELSSAIVVVSQV